MPMAKNLISATDLHLAAIRRRGAALSASVAGTESAAALSAAKSEVQRFSTSAWGKPGSGVRASWIAMQTGIWSDYFDHNGNIQQLFSGDKEVFLGYMRAELMTAAGSL